MLNRRHLVMLGAALIRPTRAFAGPAGQRLETRLFNFKDEVSPEQTSEIIAAMKEVARAPGVGGFLIGRNFIPDPFPTRFEWISMIQFEHIDRGADDRRFESLRNQLSTLCRNQVDCELTGPTAPRFADGAGVKVRHTVMFDFKPDASPEDQARNVDAIRAMGRLPMVQAYRVERSTADLSDPTRMQWQVIGDFASVADYRAYSQAPVHLAIRDDFKVHTSRVAFLDVEL